MILQERTSMFLMCALCPIMVGLSLCSAFEIHFHIVGFAVALAANLSECLQNVLSKRLLTTDKYEANQIQLFTSFYSIILQIPIAYYLLYTKFSNLTDVFSNGRLWASYLAAGLSFHLQSLTEYALLSIISPVSHRSVSSLSILAHLIPFFFFVDSVANTVKRAVLIWLSVLLFHNPVTIMSWLGTGLVIFGVFLYNKAKEALTAEEDKACLLLGSHKTDHVDSV